MESPRGEMLLFADCGVVIEPTVEQLVQIAHASVSTWTTLIPHIPPKVAFLSFSSKGSARHKESEKVSAAAALFKERFPDVVSDGELQFDAAFVPKVARVKAPESPIAGQANCFIFPNLNAGNIAYKLVQRLAGYRAYGPILQGLAKPFSDLSRGASVQDLVTCTYINQARC
jgi:phosphate acetyltransferase